MIRWIRNKIKKIFTEPELCAECGRKLIVDGVLNTIYPFTNNNSKIENVHRMCLYQYLLKRVKDRNRCDYIYKALTK